VTGDGLILWAAAQAREKKQQEALALLSEDDVVIDAPGDFVVNDASDHEEDLTDWEIWLANKK